MEPGDNENPTQSHQGIEHPNPQQPPNISIQIDEGLATLRSFVHELKGKEEPRRFSLATSLETIVSSIPSSQGKLTTISKHMARMFKLYNSRLDRNQVRDLNISKQNLMSLFIDPRTRVKPHVKKKCICMDWCIHPQFFDNSMDSWFMVFDKPPCNNMEVPLYFLRKLWAEFILGHHVNYFDIGDFQGVGQGYVHD
jgi:hypothetical protein